MIAVVDQINGRFGRDMLRLAASGIKQPWGMRQARRSPQYTTRWRIWHGCIKPVIGVMEALDTDDALDGAMRVWQDNLGCAAAQRLISFLMAAMEWQRRSSCN